MKYSIIIPVYNAEPYLSDCIRSIFAQAVRDYEVILVNDGSTDKSEAICREYVGQDSRFRLISQPNSGPLAARMAGIRAARGEYVLFLDADDQWLPHTLAVLDAILTEHRADVLVFFFQRFDCQGEEKQLTAPIPGTHYYDKSQFRDYVSRWLQNTALNAMWLKAVRRACLVHPQEAIPPISFGDDLLQTAWVLHCARSLVCTDRVLYRYRITPGSILNCFRPRYVGDIAAAYAAVYRFLQRDFAGDAELERVFFRAYGREICNAVLHLFRTANSKEIGRWTEFLRTNALFRRMMEMSLPHTPRQCVTWWLVCRNRPRLSKWTAKLIFAVQSRRNGKKA